MTMTASLTALLSGATLLGLALLAAELQEQAARGRLVPANHAAVARFLASRRAGA